MFKRYQLTEFSLNRCEKARSDESFVSLICMKLVNAFLKYRGIQFIVVAHVLVFVYECYVRNRTVVCYLRCFTGLNYVKFCHSEDSNCEIIYFCLQFVRGHAYSFHPITSLLTQYCKYSVCNRLPRFSPCCSPNICVIYT